MIILGCFGGTTIFGNIHISMLVFFVMSILFAWKRSSFWPLCHHVFVSFVVFLVQTRTGRLSLLAASLDELVHQEVLQRTKDVFKVKKLPMFGYIDLKQMQEVLEHVLNSDLSDFNGFHVVNRMNGDKFGKNIMVGKSFEKRRGLKLMVRLISASRWWWATFAMELGFTKRNVRNISLAPWISVRSILHGQPCNDSFKTFKGWCFQHKPHGFTLKIWPAWWRNWMNIMEGGKNGRGTCIWPA